MNTRITVELKSDLLKLAREKHGGEVPCRVSAESDLEKGHFVYAKCTPGIATHKVVFAKKAKKARVYLQGRLVGVMKVD